MIVRLVGAITLLSVGFGLTWDTGMNAAYAQQSNSPKAQPKAKTQPGPPIQATPTGGQTKAQQQPQSQPAGPRPRRWEVLCSNPYLLPASFATTGQLA